MDGRGAGGALAGDARALSPDHPCRWAGGGLRGEPGISPLPSGDPVARVQQLKPSRQILPLSMAQLRRATRFLAPVLVKMLLT